MTVLYAVTAPTGLIGPVVLAQNTLNPWVSDYNGIGIDFNAATSEGYLPTEVVPASGTLMLKWAITSNNYGAISLTSYNMRINNWYFMKRANSLDMTVYFRTSTDTLTMLTTFNMAGSAGTAQEFIFQFTPTTLKVISNAVTIGDFTGAGTPKNELAIGWRNYEVQRHVVSEVTLHDTVENKFFMCKYYNYTLGSNSGFVGSVDNMKDQTTSAMVAAALGSTMTLNMSAFVAPAIPTTGALLGMFQQTGAISDLSPFKVKVTHLNGATDIGNATYTYSSAMALKYGFLGTAIATNVKFEVLAS